MNRKKIEDLWMAHSARDCNHKGYSLCFFLDDIRHKSADLFHEEIAGTMKKPFISEYFLHVANGQNEKDMTYLCRALTLNMFLDNEGIK